MIMSEDKYPTSGIACNNQGLVTFFGQGAEELFGRAMTLLENNMLPHFIPKRI